MDDLSMMAIGREFARLATQAEQLYQENKNLQAKIAELEKKKAKAK